MFEEAIDGKRLMAMAPQEIRWMENLKKAIYESDKAVAEGLAADKAFPEICKAVDVAATLRVSLLTPASPWSPPATTNDKRKFIEFLHYEIPEEDQNGVSIPLVDARSQQPVRYNFGGIVYAIRCMIHENENLNADEHPDYHVTLNWNLPRHGYFGSVCDGRLTCNATAIWWREREVLVKFIVCTDMLMGFERGDKFFSTRCDEELMSIHPGDGRHRLSNAQ